MFKQKASKMGNNKFMFNDWVSSMFSQQMNQKFGARKSWVKRNGKWIEAESGEVPSMEEFIKSVSWGGSGGPSTMITKIVTSNGVKQVKMAPNSNYMFWSSGNSNKWKKLKPGRNDRISKSFMETWKKWRESGDDSAPPDWVTDKFFNFVNKKFESKKSWVLKDGKWVETKDGKWPVMKWPSWPSSKSSTIFTKIITSGGGFKQIKMTPNSNYIFWTNGGSNGWKKLNVRNNKSGQKIIDIWKNWRDKGKSFVPNWIKNQFSDFVTHTFHSQTSWNFVNGRWVKFGGSRGNGNWPNWPNGPMGQGSGWGEIWSAPPTSTVITKVSTRDGSVKQFKIKSDSGYIVWSYGNKKKWKRIKFDKTKLGKRFTEAWTDWVKSHKGKFSGGIPHWLARMFTTVINKRFGTKSTWIIKGQKWFEILKQNWGIDDVWGVDDNPSDSSKYNQLA